MPPNQPPKRPASRPKPKIGLQADFEQMLSALPDYESPVESETVIEDQRPAASAPRRRPAAAPTSSFTPPRATPAADGASITQRILDELEKYSIPAVSQLRIAVHDGSVTIVGDVPGDYEKQLIVHFCRKVPGVAEVVDMMRIGGAAALAGSKVSRSFAKVPKKHPAKNWKPSYTLQLPFRARHVGAAVGLIAVVWAGLTFATRDGSRMSVVPVSGRVTFDGAVPEGANVTLHPLDRALAVRPKGFVAADGTFRLTTYLPSDGAPPGAYKLTIEWHKTEEVGGDIIPGPNLLPPELSQPDTSTYTVTIESGTSELPPLQIGK